ncbi:MAG: hypothetical protein AAFO83_04325 [Cyanobacteria bacterium J06607_13]
MSGCVSSGSRVNNFGADWTGVYGFDGLMLADVGWVELFFWG